MTTPDPDLIDCSWCEQRHSTSWLCDAAREVLNRLHAKSKEAAAAYDMPTIELQDPYEDDLEGILCKAFSVRGFYTEVLKVYRPGIAIDPITVDGIKLKPLILLDTDTNMRRVGRLFEDMTSLAVRRARRARDEAFKNRSI